MFEGIFTTIKDLIEEFMLNLKGVYSDTPFYDIFNKENFLWEFNAFDWLYTILVCMLITCLIILIIKFFKLIAQTFGGLLWK